MLVYQLVLIYMGLLTIELVFDLNMRLISFLLMMSSFLVSMTYFSHGFKFVGTIWLIMSLFELLSFISAEE
jgi:hypothetical protein